MEDGAFLLNCSNRVAQYLLSSTPASYFLYIPPHTLHFFAREGLFTELFQVQLFTVFLLELLDLPIKPPLLRLVFSRADTARLLHALVAKQGGQ